MTSSKKTFAVSIGLDWADKKHDICMQVADNDKRQFKIISHTPEAIDEWIVALHKEVKGDIAIALELNKGPIVYALQKYSFVTVYPIHGLSLARYRQAMFPSGAKDDPSDAELALDMMLKYPEKVTPIKPSSEQSRMLAYMVQQRRALVDDKRSTANRLINALKQYYPQVLEWFSHRDSRLFCEFVLKWSTLQSVKRVRSDTIRKFFKSRGGKSNLNVERHITHINSALPLTEDNGVIVPHRLLASALCRQIITIIENIKIYDAEIKKVFDSMPDAELFNSLPGTGKCLAPRLLAAIGEDRNRFNNAQALQNYAGLSPVTERSGQKSWVHWRWHCSKFVRQSFIEWSEKSVAHSYWAGQYYAQQRAKDKSHQQAVRALAYKWARIVYRCWQTKIPYDESKYLKVLREKGSPLLAA